MPVAAPATTRIAMWGIVDPPKALARIALETDYSFSKMERLKAV